MSCSVVLSFPLHVGRELHLLRVPVFLAGSIAERSLAEATGPQRRSRGPHWQKNLAQRTSVSALLPLRKFGPIIAGPLHGLSR